ncbi:MAG: hypothetical protein QXP70_05310 [Methanomassiliicoccales archaeon]
MKSVSGNAGARITTKYPSEDTEAEISVENAVRRVQKFGNASLGVSIPKEWADARGIKAGSLLNLVFDDSGAIRIEPAEGNKEPSSSKCVVHADSCPEKMLERILIGCYITGYGTIIVDSKSGMTPEISSSVENVAEKLIGAAIVEQDSRRIVIACLVAPSEFPIMAMIRRLFLLSTMIVERTLENALTMSEKSLGAVQALEMEIDKLYRLILRLLLLAASDREVAKQSGVDDPRHTLGNRAIAASLESVGDIAEALSGYLYAASSSRKDQRKSDERILKLLSQFREMTSSAAKCLFEHDLKSASSALDNVLQLEKLCIDGITISGENRRSRQEKNEGEGIFDTLIFTGMRSIVREYELIIYVMMNRFIERPDQRFPYLEASV